VTLASGNVRKLTAIRGVRAGIVGTQPGFPDAVLVSLNARNRTVFDVNWVNCRISARPGHVEPGRRGGLAFGSPIPHPRGQRQHPDGGTRLRVHDDSSASWRRVFKVGSDSNHGLHDFAPDGQGAFRESSHARTRPPSSKKAR